MVSREFLSQTHYDTIPLSYMCPKVMNYQYYIIIQCHSYNIVHKYVIIFLLLGPVTVYISGKITHGNQPCPGTAGVSTS